MKITANDPNRKSWLPVDPDSDFPIQNIPFGVFITRHDVITIGTKIGSTCIDLAALHQLGYFEGIPLTEDIFMQDTLNDFIDDGKISWRLVRNRIADIFDLENPILRDNQKHREEILFDEKEVEMLMPVNVCDFTDFYSSKEHATNVGKLFRDPNNPLLPNWLHIPIGYHGRCSSIVKSGTKIRRPRGQRKSGNNNKITFGPTRALDFEVELGFITTGGNKLGNPISINESEDYIFGMVLLNDWSARDIQAWEYVPLGPFLGKSFATTISPWIITMDALQPFRVEGPVQKPKPLSYIFQEGKNNYDIHLQAAIKPKKQSETVVCNTNFKNTYWTVYQQLTHQTSNGCNIRTGDLYGSGTISGETKDSFGSMLELTWNGTQPIQLNDNSERTFLENGDTVILRGYCKNDLVRIGFGECTGEIKKVKKKKKKKKINP